MFQMQFWKISSNKNKACVHLMISSHIGKIPNIFNDTVINMDNYTPIKQNQNYDNCLF